MPFCSTCGAHFDGRGTYCTYHNPYLQNYFAYNGGATNPSGIKYRVGTRFPLATMTRRRKPRTLGFRDSYEALPDYDTRETLVRYNDNHAVSGRMGVVQTDPMVYSTTNRPLAQTFTSLSHAHAMKSLTYNVSPTGAQSMTATVNLDREQCSVCLMFFPDRRRLETHLWEYPIGCEVHGVCLREEDAEWHASNERHERCFVRGCGSVYRREGGWKRAVVERHVGDWHSCG